MLCGDNCYSCVTPSLSSSALIDNLIAWLSAVTCIPWFNSNEDAQELKTQFGVVELVQAEASTTSASEKIKIDEDNYCLVRRRYFDFSINLSVKGVRSVVYSSSEQDTNINITPMDVLMDVVMHYENIDEIKSTLDGLTIMSFGEIESDIVNDNKCCWYSRANMNITTCHLKKVSREAKIIKEICLKICDGQTNCPKENDIKECD